MHFRKIDMLAHWIFRTAHRWLPLRLLVLVLLTSCGGVDSGGTGSSAAYGAVSGLGSIIVNGVRFDESTAAITDEDGQPIARDQLRLGMMTSVAGSGIVSTANERRATAHRVRILSELIGPIGVIDASTQIVEVLGQAVHITPATVFGDGLPAGVASLHTGMVVEVFARLDSAKGSYAATRIEQRLGVTSYVLRGKVDAVDAAARTFSVGTLEIDFSRVTATDAANVVKGKTVRVRLETAPSGGVWRAVSVSSGQRPIADGEEASVEGRISAFESLQRFSVDGVPVDATVASFPDGTGAIALGARVSVEGSAMGGVVYATVVEVEGDEDSSNSEFEVHGTIDALDLAGRAMTVRGIAVDFSGAVTFEGGTIADLRVGKVIEVKGVLQPDGVGLVAKKIEFKSD
jgi:Domain of unknown function (DUF5666)